MQCSRHKQDNGEQEVKEVDNTTTTELVRTVEWLRMKGYSDAEILDCLIYITTATEFAKTTEWLRAKGYSAEEIVDCLDYISQDSEQTEE